MKIPVEVIREAVEKWMKENEKNFAEVAAELGWYHDKDQRYGDTVRIKRTLGLIAETSHHKKYVRRTIGEDVAVMLIRHIGRAPREFDL